MQIINSASDIRNSTAARWITLGSPALDDMMHNRIIITDQPGSYRGENGFYALNVAPKDRRYAMEQNFQIRNQAGRALRVLLDFNITELNAGEVAVLADPNFKSSREFKPGDRVFHLVHQGADIENNRHFGEGKYVVLRRGQYMPINVVKHNGLIEYEPHKIVLNNKVQIENWNRTAMQKNRDIRQGLLYPLYDPDSVIGHDKYSFAVMMHQGFTIVLFARRRSLPLADGTFYQEPLEQWKSHVMGQEFKQVDEGYRHEIAQDLGFTYKDFVA